jgi:hypothetical protein
MYIKLIIKHKKINKAKIYFYYQSAFYEGTYAPDPLGLGLKFLKERFNIC